MIDKSKLFGYIKLNTKHRIVNLSISDLFDETCKDKEFSEKLFKHLMKEDLLADEEEMEENLLRVGELFKRDILINFTDVEQFNEIPNLINNNGINNIMFSDR